MNNNIEEADIDHLDQYLESFYEDNAEAKISSSRKILLLILDFKNLNYLLSHGNLTHL